MKKKIACLSVIIAILAGSAARAYSGSWRRALPGYRYRFPRDHGAHQEFKTEWWYFSGNLKGAHERRYAFMLTFFRTGLRPEAPRKSRSRWALRNLYFAHFSVLDAKRGRHRFFERFSRGALEQAGASEEGLDVWIRDWRAKSVGSGDALSLSISAAAPGTQLRLTLKPQKPLVIHGERGVHQKAEVPGRASHYYSYSRLLATGVLEVGGETLNVRGTVWMDHEFGSSQLTKDQVGWDWMSLQLSDGRDLMLYLLRRKDGSLEPSSGGTLVEADGRARRLRLGEFRFKVTGRWRSEKSGAVYPIEWEIDIPAHDLRLRVRAYSHAQEIDSRFTMIIYWEGGVFAKSLSGENDLTGAGFVEMTGYASKGRPRF